MSPVTLGPDSLPTFLDLNDCRGVVVSIAEPIAPHGATPKGWDPGVKPVSTVDLWVYQCARIGWGAFERGPVFMLLETHGQFSLPESCRDTDVGLYRMLESVWFSDADVAAFAKGQYGMNAGVADFSVDDDASGEVVKMTWRWTPPGAQTSEIVISEVPPDAEHPVDELDRLFWPNGPGVSYWDLRVKDILDDVTQRSATGTMPAPMLHGRTNPTPEFLSPNAAPTTDDSLHATIHRFKDTQCGQPA